MRANFFLGLSRFTHGLLLVALLFAVPPNTASAGPPLGVAFDVTQLITCQDVTPTEFAEANPGERLVDAAFNISSLFQHGREADLGEFFYRIESPWQTLRFVDHLPRTHVGSPIVGPVTVEKKKESSGRIGLGVSGQYEPVKGDASAEIRKSNGTVLRYDLLPPKELLAASGTLNRERGVYFKLKPSTLNSLEGAKQFVCVLRVPASWRGDCVRITCEATAQQRRLFPPSRESVLCGRDEFLVGLYAEGDEAARQTVLRVVRAEEQLLVLLRDHGAALCQAAHASDLPGYAKLRTLLDRSSPRSVLEQFLAQGRWQDTSQAMPGELRAAVAELDAARQEVRTINGGQETVALGALLGSEVGK